MAIAADTHAPGRTVISPDGERSLRAELAHLRRQLEVEFPERLRDARGFGEIGQNDDYLQIKEEEAVLAARILRLQVLLSSAATSKPSPDVGASIGSIVKVEDTTSAEVSNLRLTGDYGELAPDAVSASSPIGRALLGRAPGDEVTVVLPDGRERILKITEVGGPVRS